MRIHVSRMLLYSVIGATAVITWLFVVGAFAVLADDNPSGDTIPPLRPFAKTVQPAENSLYGEAVFSGQEVLYTISMHNTISESYSAKIGVTDTLPAGLVVIPTTIDTSSGEARWFDIDETSYITWVVDVEYGKSYTLTYRANALVIELTTTTPSSVTLVNSAVLYEISNQYAPPTTITETAAATITVHPWGLYLPLISRPHSVLAQFDNYNFEPSTKLNNGWEQLVDGKNDSLIYSATQANVKMVDGGNYAVWMGGAPNQTNRLSQVIKLPDDYTDLNLRFLYWIYSEEESCDNDRAEVRVNDDLIQTFQLCVAKGTFNPASGHGWMRAVQSLTAHKGEAATVSFVSTLNGSKNSNFFVDVVQLCSDDENVPDGTVRCSDWPP